MLLLNYPNLKSILSFNKIDIEATTFEFPAMIQTIATDYLWQYYGVKIDRHPEALLRQKKAIDEQVKNPESQPIKIYPNPAYDFLTIATTHKNSIVEITISDFTGRTLQQIIPNTPDFSYNLNIGHYLNGV